MKYNYVTSLIVIVDVVAPPTDPKGKIESMDSPDESRIMKHIGQWNESALSAVFGLLTNSLQYVCLFINKMDVITSHDEVSFEKIENDYLPIKNILKKYCHTIDFEVLLGSAKNGMNVQELENRILQHSVSDSE